MKNITTSTTRTSMEFQLNSEEYEFMGFYNPVLIDSNGVEHETPSLYPNENIQNGNKNIEFQGEIKDGNITFVRIELVDKNKENLELYLESIIKDKTEALEFKLN